MSSLSRKTQQLKEKMGKSDAATKDIPYSNAKMQMEQDYKKLKLMLSQIQKVAETYAVIQSLQSQLCLEFLDLYTENGPLRPTMENYDELVKQYDTSRANFASTLENDILNPLKVYLEQFKEIKKRCDELNSRRLDMDRYNEKRIQMTEKTTGSKEKLPEIEHKFRLAKELYEQLLAELMKDLAALHDDIYSAVSPIFASFVRAHSAFLDETTSSLSTLPPKVANVDVQAFQSHQSVITPKELSVLTAPPPNVSAQPAPEADNTAAHSASSRPVPPQPPARPPKPSAPSMPRARGLYNFTASDNTELSFNKGDVLEILEQNGDWWMAELNGQKGQIPANYVQLM